MYDEDLREAVDCYILIHFINCFAFTASESAFFHSFRGGEILETVVEVETANCHSTRYGQRQVHETIEGQALVPAFLALYLATKLSLEQVSYYRVVSFFEVLVPDLRLLKHWQFITIYLLVLRFLTDSVQLIVHSVKHEAEKLLRVLLAVAAKLAGNAADLTLQVGRRDGAAPVLTCLVQQLAVARGQPAIPDAAVLREPVL